ncbi:acyltransferase family protein [Aurantimonas sp. C2-6-R+9]|uniref:acyltransferase family protein n=1 Tax=unclassified Aurantimonas TaxID=2638230 RepID=UPI002E18F114|nr:acyltransferase family protein [Aurantimonas sp. C2-6-R+9]
MISNTDGLTIGTRYRPEIDGLRAIAVVAVVLYHLDPSFAPGGFLGVDVFFVISGFLIATSVLADAERGAFSFLTFYDRRARRLAAPLLLVLASSFLLGYLLLLPDDYAAFASSAFAAVFLHANHHFLETTGYFSPDAHSKPLLHTWSLAIEEQFYIFFPALIVAVRKWGGSRHLGVLGVAAALSFGACVAIERTYGSLAFFLLPFRAWEMLLGALLAVAIFKDRFVLSGRATEFCSTLGLTLVLASIALFDSGTRHPGFPTLLPCVGAAMLILGSGRRKTCAGRLLASAPLVGMGRLSYALYLWHWPLIVFVIYYLDRSLTGSEQAVLFAISIALSFATLVLVENPVRFRKTRFLRGETLFGTIAAIALLSGASLAITRSGGLPHRVDPDVFRIADARNDWTQDQIDCVDLQPEAIIAGDVCRFRTRRASARRVLLWGDSHATALLPPLADLAEAGVLNLTFLATNGCPPIFDLETEKGDCAAANDAVRMRLKAEEFDVVIVAANWQSYGRSNPVRFLTPEQGQTLEGRLRFGAWSTLRWTSERVGAVLVIGQVPVYTVDVPTHLARALFFGPLDRLAGTRRRPPAPRLDPPYLLGAAREAGVPILSPAASLCVSGNCRMIQDGLVLYKDSGHLSSRGARAVLTDPLARALMRLPERD